MISNAGPSGVMELVRLQKAQDDIHAVVKSFGGQQAWFDACRRWRQSDWDYGTASTLVRLIRRNHTRRCTNSPREWAKLGSDRPVQAYWLSVADAGDEGWREERRRIREIERAAAEFSDLRRVKLMLDVWAVRSLLPLYRSWGQMLIEAQVAGNAAGHQP